MCSQVNQSNDTFKKENLCSLSQETKSGEYFFIQIQLYPNVQIKQNIRRKENYRPKSLMDIDSIEKNPQ